jgi:hypothetical protein
LFSGHEYGNAVFTAVAELETEVADPDDVSELELVPAIDEVSEELVLVLTVDEVSVSEELELVLTVDEVSVSEELELVPTVDEVSEELAEIVRLEEVVPPMMELELELELGSVGGPAEKTTDPSG